MSNIILLKSKKKFAYQTTEEALESFIARKTRQIEILKHQLYIARTAKEQTLNNFQISKNAISKSLFREIKK